jgi:hypothetical protein
VEEDLLAVFGSDETEASIPDELFYCSFQAPHLLFKTKPYKAPEQACKARLAFAQSLYIQIITQSQLSRTSETLVGGWVGS